MNQYKSGVFLPLSTYTLSNGIDTGSSVYFQVNDDNGNKLYTLANPTSTKEILSRDGRIILYSGPLSIADVSLRPSLNVGSSVLPYEPYRGQTYTADFGETVYGGTLDWSTGVLTVTWLCVIFTGTEEWIASGDVDNIFSRSLPMLAKVANRYNFKCSHYKTQVAKNDSFWVESTGVKARIQAEFNSTDEWMGYVTAQYNNGTPLQILYEINQPYTIQLTPAQILAISGLNTVYCDTGDVTVTGYEDPRHTVAQLTSRIAALESAATGI